MATEEEQKAQEAKRRAFGEWTTFLESTPPNVAKVIANLADYVGVSSGITQWKVSRPRLKLHCDIDDGLRGFDDTERSTDIGYQFLHYRCRDCGRQLKAFSVLIGLRDRDHGIVEVMKLGEYPPFAAPISARIAKLLGPQDLALYRQGTRAEAQGLGIGAATYFRRVVENQWRLLVKELRQAAEKLGVRDLAVYDEASTETQFSNAVRKLKDAIPGKLLILDGENPLTLLHQPLSIQLHTLSDEECLQQAEDIRLVLTAMLENIADALSDHAELKGAVNRLKQVRS